MEILSYITGQKQRFKNNSSDEEIRNARRGYIQSDKIEVYEEKPKSISQRIGEAKQGFRNIIAKGKMIKEERREQQNERMTKKIEDLKIKTKLEKQKMQYEKYRQPSKLERISQGLQKLGGENNRNIPTGLKTKVPNSKKKNVIQQDNRTRNVFGGGNDPFS